MGDAKLAARQGFEPRSTGPEPAVLPLDERAALGDVKVPERSGASHNCRLGMGVRIVAHLNEDLPLRLQRQAVKRHPSRIGGPNFDA